MPEKGVYFSRACLHNHASYQLMRHRELQRAILCFHIFRVRKYIYLPTYLPTYLGVIKDALDRTKLCTSCSSNESCNFTYSLLDHSLGNSQLDSKFPLLLQLEGVKYVIMLMLMLMLIYSDIRLCIVQVNRGLILPYKGSAGSGYYC